MINHYFSVKQPWAWLIINGYKSIENRDTLIPKQYELNPIGLHCSSTKYNERERISIYNKIKDILRQNNETKNIWNNYKCLDNFFNKMEGCIVGYVVMDNIDHEKALHIDNVFCDCPNKSKYQWHIIKVIKFNRYIYNIKGFLGISKLSRLDDDSVWENIKEICLDTINIDKEIGNIILNTPDKEVNQLRRSEIRKIIEKKYYLSLKCCKDMIKQSILKYTTQLCGKKRRYHEMSNDHDNFKVLQPKNKKPPNKINIITNGENAHSKLIISDTNKTTIKGKEDNMKENHEGCHDTDEIDPLMAQLSQWKFNELMDIERNDVKLYEDMDCDQLKIQLMRSKEEAKQWKDKAQMLAKILKPKEEKYNETENENILLKNNITNLTQRHDMIILEHKNETSKLNEMIKDKNNMISDLRMTVSRQQICINEWKKKLKYVCNQFNYNENDIIIEMSL